MMQSSAIHRAAEALVRELIAEHIRRCTIVLQFADDRLKSSVSVSDRLASIISSMLSDSGVELDVDYFVLADSNFGNVGADDISAMHVPAEPDNPIILVRFGDADLTTTGALPLMLVPDIKPIRSIDKLIDGITQRISPQGGPGTAWIVYESAVMDEIPRIAEGLRQRGFRFEYGRLPCTADLTRWSMRLVVPSDSSVHRIGGLEFAGGQCRIESSDALVYIGTSATQLQSIFMQYPQHNVVHYDPEQDHFLDDKKGEDLRVYKQRAYAIQVREHPLTNHRPLFFLHISVHLPAPLV